MSINGFNTVFYKESLVFVICYLKLRYKIKTIVDFVVNTGGLPIYYLNVHWDELVK